MVTNPVRLAVSLALLGVAGCDESTTLVLEPNPAVRILIDASGCPTIPRCRSCILETEAFDKNSQPAPFPTLIWSSGNEGIATVESRPDGQAKVNGWKVGSTSISVEVLETGASDDVEVTIGSSMVQCQPPE
ncbi:MAG TPA: hypothetical protein VFH11_03920 [Gemmatimonadota bacterium]|nr:hypothetical protein [Gemmatimonadota bacterium]